MTTLGDVLDGIRKTIVLHERIKQLARKVERMEERERDLTVRLVRLETSSVPIGQLARLRQNFLTGDGLNSTGTNLSKASVRLFHPQALNLIRLR